jgi:hypothetical protein
MFHTCIVVLLMGLAVAPHRGFAEGTLCLQKKKKKKKN